MIDPVSEIKTRLDIVDVVGQYTQLKKAGVNFKGLCPFHNEKTPSFMVSPEKQIAYCFGCHKGGDIFQFIIEVESLGFREALELLANRAGVTLPEDKVSMERKDIKTKVFEVNKLAMDFYMHVLWNTPTGKNGREYLKKRQIDETLARFFGLGMALDDWDILLQALKKKDITEKVMMDAGLVVKKDKGSGFFDKFRNRLIFPIKNNVSLVVGFAGRAFADDVQPKYLNTAETIVYHKSDVLYNFDQAKSEIKRQDMVIVVEGYMDVIASYKTMVKNVVGVSGTAFTDNHIKLIKRLTNRVAFAFDVDLAGMNAAMRAIEMALIEDMEVFVVRVPDGKDADECIKKDPTLWERACEKPIPYLDFIIEQALVRFDVKTAEGRREASKMVLVQVKKLVSPIQQDFYLQKLAGELGVNIVVLREELQTLHAERVRGRVRESEIKIKLYTKEDYIYGILLNNPHLFVPFDEMCGADYMMFSRDIRDNLYNLKSAWEKGELKNVALLAQYGPLTLKIDEMYGDFKDMDFVDELKILFEGIRGKGKKELVTFKIESLRKAETEGDKKEILKLKNELNDLLSKK